MTTPQVLPKGTKVIIRVTDFQRGLLAGSPGEVRSDNGVYAVVAVPGQFGPTSKRYMMLSHEEFAVKDGSK